MNERPIPEAALRDKDSVEMLRVWIAEKSLQCSIKIGMYQHDMKVSESKAWGIILADITRHVANALHDMSSAEKEEIIQDVCNSYLQEIRMPTSKATGKFVNKDKIH